MSRKKDISIDILKKYWGYDAFRLKQSEVIDNVLNQKDTLVLFPTGGGKSLCYQIPGIALKGVCIVISPLISLMKDQVDELVSRNISAHYLFSGTDFKEKNRIWNLARKEQIDFLFLSPESISNKFTLAQLKELNINLIAIDEAHCISEWGHDFRPSYLKISDTLKQLDLSIPKIALTATATPQVLEEIINKLQLNQPNYFISSFKRSNLAYFVLPNNNMHQQIEKIILKNKGTGIIYCSTRKKCEETAQWLSDRRIKCQAYHAGLSSNERSAIQESWKKGELPIVIATNAFGMGVNKEDVRWVIHIDLPINCEAYFQEAGRAGRDGKKAFAILFKPTNSKDWKKQQLESQIEKEIIKETVNKLYQHFNLTFGEGQDKFFSLDVLKYCKKKSISPFKLKKILLHLENEEFIRTYKRPKDTILFRFINIHFSIDEFDDQQYKLLELYELLLRKHAHEHYSNIELKADYYSSILNIHPHKIIKLMRHLENLGLIKVLEKNALQISFLYPREKKMDKYLSLEKLEGINKHRENQLEDISLYFTNNTICRTAWMMDYFGENSIHYNCGICDICVKRKKNKSLLPRVLASIKKPISITDLKKQFTILEINEVNTILDKLLIEEKIKIEDNILIPLQSFS